MNPSRVGRLPYTYIAMTNFVCENCIGKWCRVTTMLGTSELNKVTGWLCEILPTGQRRVLTKCNAVIGPSAQKHMSDPATNVVCIRQAKKQLNNPNKDLAVPDATTAWKEATTAQQLLWDMTRSMYLINIAVKCMPASCCCCNWDNTHISLPSPYLRKQEIKIGYLSDGPVWGSHLPYNSLVLLTGMCEMWIKGHWKDKVYNVSSLPWVHFLLAL